MPKIPHVIQTRNFEHVRRRVAEILQIELNNQSEIGYDEDLDLTVWEERITPISHAEKRVVNVRLNSDEFDNFFQLNKDGTISIAVDVYATYAGDGSLSMKKLQKILGVIDAILSDSRYKTLGFAKPSLSRVQVNSIEIADQKVQHDATNTCIGRVNLSVRVQETVEPVTPTLLDGYDTIVLISDSDSGYQYETPSPCLPGTVQIINSANQVIDVVIVDSGQNKPYNLADTPVLVTDQDGNPLANENLPSVTGGTIQVETGGVCLPANYVVEYANGTPIESGTIPSGGSVTVVVPNCPPAGDVVWTLFDSDGNVLDSGTEPAGGTLTIVAPDATFDINGVQVATIPSGGSDSIQVRKATGNDQIGSLQGQYWRIPDSKITLVDTDSNTLSTTDVPATESATITAPNATVTVRRDGVFYADVDVLSNGTATIDVPSVAPTPKGQMPLKTFQTTPQGSGTDGDLQQGYGVSYAVMPYNNPFGNTERFTAPDGSQTYTDAIACDWLTWNDSTNTVLMIHFGSAAGEVMAVNRNLADGITYINGLTVGGYSGWNMINKNQLENITENETSLNNLNVSPFNIGTLAIQTNTAYTATQRAVRLAGGNMALNTSTARTLAVRIGTVTGTVIS